MKKNYNLSIKYREKKYNALEEENIVLKQMIEAMPGHVYWKDKKGIFLGCNDNMAKRAGFNTSNDLIGKTDYDMSWKQQADNIVTNDQKVMLENRAHILEEIGEMSTGDHRIFLSQKAPLKNISGEIIGIFGFSIDITEKKEAEKLQVEISKIKEKFKVVKTLAGTIAHEIRTPIAAIKLRASHAKKLFLKLISGYQDHLKSKPDSPHKISDFQLKNLSKMPESVEQIANSCSEIVNLQLSNIGSGNEAKTVLDLCNMQLVLITAFKQYPFEGNDLALLHYQAKDFANFHFLGDERLVKHVLWNLMQNALYYVQAAGKGEIQLWPEETDSCYILHFKDTGTGMTDKVAKQAFERFFTNRRHGTGLGLPFCKEVMQTIGGEIILTTKEAEFTHFKLYFPKPTKR